MYVLKILLLSAGAYMAGGLSISILLSRSIYGKDVRTCGSGNAGATNMARSFGLKMGIITLMCDAFKAVVSVLIGNALLGEFGVCIAGIACLMGHCFPALHGFKGGKGVSVCAALMWWVDWRVGLVGLAAFALAAAISRRVSLGSVCAALALTVTALIIAPALPKLILALVCTVTVVFMHRENIKRLLSGTEPEFRFKH